MKPTQSGLNDTAQAYCLIPISDVVYQDYEVFLKEVRGPILHMLRRALEQHEAVKVSFFSFF